jgi:SpoIID/LytB domain protein
MKVGLMSSLHRQLASRLALLVTVALVAIVLPSTSAQAAAGDLTFVGHGYGHGRGMGQYGALGYAVDYGWSSAQILDHYYGGTKAGTAGNPEMTVDLLGSTGRDTIVTGTGLAINQVATGAVAVLVRRTASGTFQVYTAPGCGGPWTAKAGLLGSGLTISTSAAATSLDNLLSVCNGAGKRAYRGSLAVVSVGSTQMTINHLPTESYLRGVVPHESPASWGSMGGGKGMQALKAQAVAARSYALASSRPSGARTCDTTACQVYDGAGTKVTASGPWILPELALTDTAISGTAGVVRTMSNGLPVRTEFSSSTGGWSAGGTFPAVVDAGDSVAYNPNHTWATTLPFSAVGAKLGTGTIRTIAVTARNGLPAGGGRATTVTVTNTSGVVKSFTGSAVRLALGLKSDWFTISGTSLAEAQSVVKALYQDLLLRPVDAAGLGSWSLLLASGTGQPALVAALTKSPEYVRLRVGQAYKGVLGRAPDAAGLAGWSGQILAGRVPVDDVQRRFFSSQEFVNRSGGTNAGFVANMYRSILGRAATPGEVSSWVARVNHLGRGQVVNQIWFSLEAASARAGGYYQRFLKRAADPAGRANWARVMLARGEGAVRTGIAGSLEYRDSANVRYP